MEKETIGLLAGALVIISIIPYAVRTYQGKIKPNLTTWSLWTFIGLTLFLTYQSSGAKANIWPAVFGFANPFLIVFLVIRRERKWKKPDKTEKICLTAGLISILMWFFMKEEASLAQYALYVAILADACASVPTIFFVWKHPEDDRPFTWTFFALGYGLSIFAISERTTANYALPIFMFFAPIAIAWPLIRYRIGKPWREWL